MPDAMGLLSFDFEFKTQTIMKPLREILVLMLIVSSFAGTAQDQKARFGIKGGASFANLISNDINDQNMRIGFTGGLIIKSPVSDRVAIQPEILFTNKGTTAQYDNVFSGDGEFTHNFNYLEIPVLGVVNITDNINLHAGPYIAYMLNASVVNISENSDYNYVEELNENDFHRFDYGFAAGLGFQVDALGFGLRYSLGMQRVGKDHSNNSLFPDQSEESSEAFKNLRNSNTTLYLAITL